MLRVYQISRRQKPKDKKNSDELREAALFATQQRTPGAKKAFSAKRFRQGRRLRHQLEEGTLATPSRPNSD